LFVDQKECINFSPLMFHKGVGIWFSWVNAGLCCLHCRFYLITHLLSFSWQSHFRWHDGRLIVRDYLSTKNWNNGEVLVFLDEVSEGRLVTDGFRVCELLSPQNDRFAVRSCKEK
jgi:hypothetical protein